MRAPAADRPPRDEEERDAEAEPRRERDEGRAARVASDGGQV
jgi:hypothetical protein